MHKLIRAATTAAGMMIGLGMAVAAAPLDQSPTLCDGLAAKVRTLRSAAGGRGDLFSLLTQGASPHIQIAVSDAKGVSLDRNPPADMRIQFEKRFRSEFGAAEALIKELRTMDAFDVMSLRGSKVHMLVSTSGPDQCQARIFFRTTPVREVERLPDPPARTDLSNALCENLGGWGFLARVNGVDAFLEYRVTDRQESFRIVPLSEDEWGSPCTFAS